MSIDNFTTAVVNPTSHLKIVVYGDSFAISDLNVGNYVLRSDRSVRTFSSRNGARKYISRIHRGNFHD